MDPAFSKTGKSSLLEMQSSPGGEGEAMIGNRGVKWLAEQLVHSFALAPACSETAPY